jgi:hypothetical protein
MWRIRQFFISLCNFWYFRKEIWQFRDWDYTFQLRLWKKSLVPLRDCILNGYEVPETRMKKVAAMQEAITLLDRILDDVYIEEAEQRLGIDFSDNIPASEASRVINLSQELSKRDWKRLWRIFEGQNHNEYIMLLDRKSDPLEDVWAQWFDGTDMRGWWD